MKNVTTHILKFRKFLIDVWGDLDTLMEDHDWDEDGCFIDEWLQTNWELLVERELLGKTGFLNSFGIFHGRKRYHNEIVKNTHEIICLPRHGVDLVDDETKKSIPNGTRLVFHIFLKKLDVSHGLYPPFDYAGVVSEGRKYRYMVPVKDVEFFLDRVPERDRS
jgi:hypothetical protein